MRLSKPDVFELRRSLDAGVSGVIIPMVEDAEVLDEILGRSKNTSGVFEKDFVRKPIRSAF